MKSLIAGLLLTMSLGVAAEFRAVSVPGGGFMFDWYGHDASDGYGMIMSGSDGYDLFDGSAVYVMGTTPEGIIEVIEIPNCLSPEAQAVQPHFCQSDGARVLRMECDEASTGAYLCVGEGAWIDEAGPVDGGVSGGNWYNIFCSLPDRVAWDSGATHAHCTLLQ